MLRHPFPLRGMGKGVEMVVGTEKGRERERERGNKGKEERERESTK